MRQADDHRIVIGYVLDDIAGDQFSIVKQRTDPDDIRIDIIFAGPTEMALDRDRARTVASILRSYVEDVEDPAPPDDDSVTAPAPAESVTAIRPDHDGDSLDGKSRAFLMALVERHRDEADRATIRAKVAEELAWHLADAMAALYGLVLGKPKPNCPLDSALADVTRWSEAIATTIMDPAPPIPGES